MDRTPSNHSINRPLCLGSGLVALDVIFHADSDKPAFLAGGSCCNVLTILSYFGWRSFPIARLGCDVEGDRIVEDIGIWGVQDRFIERDPKTQSPRIIQKIHSGKNPKHSFSLRCAHGRWLPRYKTFRLNSLKRIESEIPPAHVFYFDRASPSSLELARHQKKLGALIVFEPPKFLDNKNFRACLEVSDIFKHCYETYLEDSQCVQPPLEIQTRGKAGLRYRSSILSQTKWTEVPAFQVDNLIDAAGSGDWLTAGLIQMLGNNGAWKCLTDASLQNALCFGQCLAALNCFCPGARGLMYRVSMQQLYSMVSEIMTGRSVKQALDTVTAKTILRTSLSSRCRICPC